MTGDQAAALFRECSNLPSDPVAAEMFYRKLAALPLADIDDVCGHVHIFRMLAERAYGEHPTIRHLVERRGA